MSDLEREAFEVARNQTGPHTVFASMAISLKRIADALEKIAEQNRPRRVRRPK